MKHEDQHEFASIDSLAKVDPENEAQCQVGCISDVSVILY